MVSLRFSKYNPMLRDNAGHYLIDEWTSFSDIGEKFSGQILDLNTYEKIETKYIKTLQQLLRDASVKTLQIKYLENYNEFTDRPLSNTYIEASKITKIYKSLLRRSYWCILHDVKTNTIVHVGHDYYTYISIPIVNSITIQSLELEGIYFEYKNMPILDIEN